MVNKMKKIIVSSKESGNTYKVCSFVSSNSDIELKVPAKIAKEDLASYDIIILASGVYRNNMHKNILAWIDSIEKDTINPNAKVYLFLTWLGRGNSAKLAFDAVKRLFGEKGIKLEDNYTQCFGKGMGLVRASHPDEEDCKNVLSWANEL